MEGRLCPRVQLVTCETMHGSLSKKGGSKHLSPLSSLPHSSEDGFSGSLFFLTRLFLSQVQMLLSKEEPTLLAGRLSRKLRVTSYCETNVKGLLFISMRGWTKGKDLHCGKGEQRTLECERDREFSSEGVLNTMRNDPPLVVYGWSELGGLLGAPLSLWRHVSYNARLWVPAFAAISAEVPLRPWGGRGGLGSEVLAAMAWLILFSRRLTRSCNRNRQTD